MNNVLVFVGLYVLSVIYNNIANKLNIIDKPNNRSSHTVPTIRGGGIVFFIAILIFFVASNFKYPYFVIGLSIIAIVSFLDDILTLSSKVRLPFQFITIALCLFQIGFTMNNFLVVIPLLIIGVGFINIYNFMDGINGITGFYSIVVLLGLYAINLEENIIDNRILIYSLMALLIFGFYNFRKKARMFAGDIGSISIAVLIFFIGGAFIRELNSPLLLLLIAVYGVDTVLTIMYKRKIGESLTEPHRHHIYQKLVDILKLPHLNIAFFYATIQLLLNIIVYLNYKKPLKIQLLILFSILTILVIIYLYLFRRLENKKK